MNQHREIRLAKAQIAGVLELLDHSLGDETLKADMIEGSTDLHEIVGQLLAENEDDDGVIGALKAQIDIRQDRVARFTNRIEARKTAIGGLMDCAQETTLRLPEATLSLRTLKGRAKVVDVDQLPDTFVNVVEVRKPDMDSIRDAAERGVAIPGVVMTNGGSSLSVRRK